jgi:hypothetical protein
MRVGDVAGCDWFGPYHEMAVKYKTKVEEAAEAGKTMTWRDVIG